MYYKVVKVKPASLSDFCVPEVIEVLHSRIPNEKQALELAVSAQQQYGESDQWDIVYRPE